MMNRFAVFFICLLPLMAWAQTQPSVDPQGTYITVEGEEIGDASASQSAPLVAHFAANPSNVGDYSARYEWKIWKEGDAGNLLLHRFDEEIDYTFTESGSFRVQLYATFVLGNDTISYPAEGEENPIMVGIIRINHELRNLLSNYGPEGLDEMWKGPDMTIEAQWMEPTDGHWGIDKEYIKRMDREYSNNTCLNDRIRDRNYWHRLYDRYFKPKHRKHYRII